MRTCRQHRSENSEGALLLTMEVDSAVFEPSVNNLTGFGALPFVSVISASVQNRMRAYYCPGDRFSDSPGLDHAYSAVIYSLIPLTRRCRAFICIDHGSLVCPFLLILLNELGQT